MKKIILITFCFLFFSCNINQKNSIKWSDTDQDEVFEECIRFAMEIDKMDSEQANKYCYCTLDIILEKFENKQVADKQIAEDPSLGYIWYEGCK